MSAPVIFLPFAHPDDEQFGKSGALMQAVERGARVVVLSATRGQAGGISDPALSTPATLGAVREQELRDACAVCGFDPPILFDYMDGRLAEVDPAGLRDAVVAEIRRLRPAIVMTFDRNGGYGHPDHIAIHHATMAAVDAAADPAHRPDLGPAHATPKVYVSATPRPVMARLNGIFVAHGFPAISFGAVQTIPNEELGTADGRVTTVIDVPDYVERKLAGMLAHRTQYGAQSPWATIPAAALAPVLGREWFVRIHPAPTGALPDEDDLLAGLPGGPA